jgi:hypothetical protein
MSEPAQHGLFRRPFDSLALLVIGAAGLLAGAKLFRWENMQRLPPGGWWWALLAVAAWLAVGVAAERLGIA